MVRLAIPGFNHLDTLNIQPFTGLLAQFLFRCLNEHSHLSINILTLYLVHVYLSRARCNLKAVARGHIKEPLTSLGSRHLDHRLLDVLYINPHHISQGSPTWKFKTKQTLFCVLLCWCWILQLSRCSLLDRRSPPSFFRVPKEKILLPPIAQIFKTTLFMRAKTMQNHSVLTQNLEKFEGKNLFKRRN